MWVKIKEWTNFGTVKREKLKTINGRTWTRRIQWLENEGNSVKLKLEENEIYKEILISQAFAQIVWERFKGNSPIDECISIFANSYFPKSEKSLKLTQQENLNVNT